MLAAVSFMLPSLLTSGQISSVGGVWVTTWKKLNGARLGTPSADRLETQATGRGVTVEASQW